MRAAHSAALTWSRMELPLATRLTAMTRSPREYVARRAFYMASVGFVTGFTSTPTAELSLVDKRAMTASGPTQTSRAMSPKSASGVDQTRRGQWRAPSRELPCSLCHLSPSYDTGDIAGQTKVGEGE